MTEIEELVRDLRARRIMCDGGNGNVYDIADDTCDQAADAILALMAAALHDKRKYSLLESQFANCHKEIARLRAELLRYAPDGDCSVTSQHEAPK